MLGLQGRDPDRLGLHRLEPSRLLGLLGRDPVNRTLGLDGRELLGFDGLFGFAGLALGFDSLLRCLGLPAGLLLTRAERLEGFRRDAAPSGCSPGNVTSGFRLFCTSGATGYEK